MVLPSLILRLEHLPRREAVLQPDDAREPVAARDQAAAGIFEVEPDSEVAAERIAQEPQPVAAAVAEAVSAANRHAGPATTVPRRVVDVAAPERLTTATPLSRWSAAVAAAHDACFVLDLNGVVISVSVASVELLGCGDAAIIGRHILEVINLVDLETGAPHPDYAPRITPLVVLDGPGLARSIMRVRHEDNAVVTLDCSSAPIHDVTGHLLGSVTFLAPIPAR